MSSHSEANTTKSKAISLADQGSVKNSEKLSQEDKRIAGLVDVTMISKFVQPTFFPFGFN